MRYSSDLIQQVWEKASVEPGFNPKILRKDEFGAWIIREHYGSRSSEYSWEIDQLVPPSEGGTDSIANLKPLQWENLSFKQSGQFVGQITAKHVYNMRVK